MVSVFPSLLSHLLISLISAMLWPDSAPHLSAVYGPLLKVSPQLLTVDMSAIGENTEMAAGR